MIIGADRFSRLLSETGKPHRKNTERLQVISVHGSVIYRELAISSVPKGPDLMLIPFENISSRCVKWAPSRVLQYRWACGFALCLYWQTTVIILLELTWIYQGLQ